VDDGLSIPLDVTCDQQHGCRRTCDAHCSAAVY